MTDDTDILVACATSLSAAHTAAASTLNHLRRLSACEGLTANDLAVRYSISLDFATMIIEGSATPEDLLSWRSQGAASLITEVYHDVDSIRHGLLSCRLDDAETVVISIHNPSEEYIEKYTSRARRLGISVRWLEPSTSLPEVTATVADMDRAAASAACDLPSGAIDDFGLQIGSDCPAVRSWVQEGDRPEVRLQDD